MQLILSLFPGIDLLGRSFEAEGFCVVRGPDLLWGGDIRDFHTLSSRFDGIIAGSPCQDFSAARRDPPTGYGLEMLEQFKRIVHEANPEWWLLENVPRVPDTIIDSYTTQRFDLSARECGSRQRRLRHFQYGNKSGYILNIERDKPKGKPERTCTATEGNQTDRRSFPDFCELQGLPRDFNLPGWSTLFKYAAVGNGVPLQMGERIAHAANNLTAKFDNVNLCACGCGRILKGKQKSATPACRKRLERKRKRDQLGKKKHQCVTTSASATL